MPHVADSAFGAIQLPNCSGATKSFPPRLPPYSLRYVINCFSKFCHPPLTPPHHAILYLGSRVNVSPAVCRTSIPWWFTNPRIAGRRRRDVHPPLVLFSFRIYAPTSSNTSSIEIKDRRVFITRPVRRTSHIWTSSGKPRRIMVAVKILGSRLPVNYAAFIAARSIPDERIFHWKLKISEIIHLSRIR